MKTPALDFEELQRRSREIFRVEAADLLRELESALLELESAPGDNAILNRVFRVMHTLKGSGATSGFQELSEFLHHVEDVYNAARESRLAINSTIIDLTLRLADAVARYLGAAPADAPQVLIAAKPELDQLLQFLPAKEEKKAAGSGAAVKTTAEKNFRISFRPHAGVFHHGFDPAMFLDDLRSLGRWTIRTDASRVPPLDAINPESCYLCWDVNLATTQDADAIRDVFMFIDGECDLVIEELAPPATRAGTAHWLIEFKTTARALGSPGILDALWKDLRNLGRIDILSSPAGTPPIGEWRIRYEGAADVPTLTSAFIFLLDAEVKMSPECGALPPASDQPTKLGDPREAERSANATKQAASGGEMLRVSSDRLDRLVNLVGQLVILRSQVSNICAQHKDLPDALTGASEALQALTMEMRDVVLNIRMMPIAQTFAKFRRVVRDLARDLDKQVELVIEGGDTEIDKTVLDALADPLMHLVRNSLDHGLENTNERRAAGKPAQGTLRLRAEHRGDRVVVTVSDDGRGLDPERIRTKAVRQGLLQPDAHPSEAELFNLIFLPGFSTAESVSQISGRGVGLDVVRRQIEQLRGTVHVQSTLGRGAEFTLSLPLTLTIIEGLMVEVADERYILPLALARETIEITRAELASRNGRNLVEIRGTAVPYIRLRDLFGVTSPSPDLERVVIVEIDGQRLGLVIDRVIGNHQTVLKSLGWLLRDVRIFSGSTVLGDGRVALVLDIPSLVAFHRSLHPQDKVLSI